MMGRLTVLKINKLVNSGLYLDGKGLYLQVSSPTAKSWIYRFALNSKRRDMGLGSYPDVSLAQAREDATRYRLMVKSGKDPIEQRKAERSLVSNLTFRDCAIQYIELHKVEWSNRKHIAQWRSTLETYAYPVFGNKSVSNVNKADILTALQPIWNEKRETASRVRQRIKCVLDWASAKDYRTELEANLWDQIAKALPSGRQKVTHHDACPYDKVSSVIRTIKTSGAEDTTKNALEFLILTAARSGEVLNALWSEIDFERKVRVIPAARMKGRKEHRIPLSSRCMEILEEQRNNGSEFIFANAKGMPYSNMTLTQMLRRHGYTFTVHGFRSAFKDWCSSETAYTYQVSELALAHSNPDKVAAAYDRTDLLEQRRGLMEDWAAYCSQSL
ncbi:tyrosine-type recombinase/integrase [Herbaspirillum huttiense]|uniref:tyrosine-type recombinase/integrase n=1 Tax=Herbaspirillum huttiense TaxID=863372 RepID=UPI0039AE9818